MVYYSNPRWRHQQKWKFNAFCENFWLCFPMFVTHSYDNHIFLVYMTFTFKATDVRANNVKHLCYGAETLSRSGLPSHPNSADNMHFSNNCSRCTMRSNKVLKSLQIKRFWRGSLYVATVTLVFICGIRIVHFFCTKKPKLVFKMQSETGLDKLFTASISHSVKWNSGVLWSHSFGERKLRVWPAVAALCWMHQWTVSLKKIVIYDWFNGI